MLSSKDKSEETPMSESEPYAKGTAKIEHATTGVVYHIDAADLEWDVAGVDDERGMGSETHWMAQVEHPALGTLSWSVWEYPEGAENMTETDENGHKIIENFQYGLS